MNLVNAWIAVRGDAQLLIKEALQWDVEFDGPYTGPVPRRVVRLFEYMQNAGTVQRMFRIRTALNLRKWHFWSVSLEGSQKLKAALVDVQADFPNHIEIIGAWHFDGRQVGTQYVYDDVVTQVDDPAYLQGTVPTPGYDPNADDSSGVPTMPDPLWVEPFPWPQIDVTNNEIVGTTGNPSFPLSSRILKWMPQIRGVDAFGDPTLYEPTVPADVNLLMGQKPRRFA